MYLHMNSGKQSETPKHRYGGGTQTRGVTKQHHNGIRILKAARHWNMPTCTQTTTPKPFVKQLATNSECNKMICTDQSVIAPAVNAATNSKLLNKLVNARNEFCSKR